MYRNMCVCELPDDLFCKVYKAIKELADYIRDLLDM